MAEYTVTNDNLDAWKEHNFATATAAVDYIKSGRIGNTFTIWWNTPVTGAPALMLRVRNGKLLEVSTVYRLPVALQRLVILTNARP
jgi:hypothetical protein